MNPNRAPRTRGLRLVAIAVAFVAVVFGSNIASAQDLPLDPTPPPSTDAAVLDPSLQLISASPWVEAEPEATFVAKLRLDGFGPGATLAYEIHNPLRGDEIDRREALAGLRNGSDSGAIFQPRRTTTIEEITSAGVTTLEIPIRSRSGRSGNRDALYVPDAGTYPIDITVRDNAGASLELRLYLNRLPEPTATQAPPVRLSTVVALRQAMGTDQSGTIDDTSVASIEAVYRRYVDILNEAARLPLGLVLSPQAIEAAGSVEDDLIQRLAESVGSHSVLSSTWANIDLESWSISGQLSSIRTSLTDGNEALTTRSLEPLDTTVWKPDDSLGPNSLATIQRLGFDLALVHPSQLANFEPTNERSGFTHRSTVTGADRTLDAMVIDPELESLLITETDQPALAAHQLLTMLAAQRQADLSARGAVLIVDDRTQLDVLYALFDEMNRALVNPTSLPAAIMVEPAGLSAVDVLNGETPVTFELQDRPTDDVEQLDELFGSARSMIDDYISVVGGDDPDATRFATIIHRAPDRRIDPEDQAKLLSETLDAMTDDLALVTLSQPRALNVTERRTTIPLRIVNGMDRPIEVTLRLKSSRLRFLDGEEQTLVLQPDLNRLDLNVEVLASGQFALQAEVLAPNSELLLASTRQTIRSTAFSGVGLILSGGAIVFLLVWWLRTPRRRDRDAENAVTPDA